jgi:hypothetical protein
MIALIVASAYLLAGNALIVTLTAVRGYDPPSLAGKLTNIAIATLICVIVHEAGHRAAGAVLGCRCVRFGFGPFEFYREGRGWKTQRVKMLWGAFVRQMPSSFAHYRRQKATTLLGGPVSSLLFGWGFALVALNTSNSGEFALFSRLAQLTMLGVLELIPANRKEIGSDGYRLWQVLRGGEGLDALLRDSMAESSNFTAVRFRDWPHDVLVRLAAGSDPYNIYLAYLHTMDGGDAEAASQYMQRLIGTLPEERPFSHYACDAAYWLALYGGDAAEARKWLSRAGEGAELEVRLRAGAAVAAAEGQFDRAESLAREALARIETLPACGANQYEVDRVTFVLMMAHTPSPV